MTDITQAPEQWLSASQSNSAWEGSNARSPSKKVLPGDPNPGFWQWSSRSLMPSHVLQWFYMVAATSCILPKDPRFSSFLLFFWSRLSSLDWRCSIRGTAFAPSKSCPIHQNSCFILSVQFLGPHFWRPQRKPCISSPLVPKCGCRKCCWDPASAEDLRWCVPSVAEWAEPGWDHPWLSGPQQRIFFFENFRSVDTEKRPYNSYWEGLSSGSSIDILTGDIIAFVLSGIWWVAWAGPSIFAAVKEQCFFLWWDDQLQSGSGSTSKIAAAAKMWFHGNRNRSFGVLEFGATLATGVLLFFSHIMASFKLLQVVLKS